MLSHIPSIRTISRYGVVPSILNSSVRYQRSSSNIHLGISWTLQRFTHTPAGKPVPAQEEKAKEVPHLVLPEHWSKLSPSHQKRLQRRLEHNAVSALLREKRKAARLLAGASSGRARRHRNRSPSKPVIASKEPASTSQPVTTAEIPKSTNDSNEEPARKTVSSQNILSSQTIPKKEEESPQKSEVRVNTPLRRSRRAVSIQQVAQKEFGTVRRTDDQARSDLAEPIQPFGPKEAVEPLSYVRSEEAVRAAEGSRFRTLPLSYPTRFTSAATAKIARIERAKKAEALLAVKYLKESGRLAVLKRQRQRRSLAGRPYKSQDVGIEGASIGGTFYGSAFTVLYEPLGLYQRRLQKARQKKPTPIGWYPHKMKCYLQFLTTPTADTPGTSLILHFDQKRYLFGNIAEGTQRACVQRKTSLIKVADIFLTGKVNWENTGGLMGMILTLADSKQSSADTSSRLRKKANTVEEPQRMRVHGGANLTHMMATARRFIFRKGMPLDVDEIKQSAVSASTEGSILPTLEDEFIKVWALAVNPSSKSMKSRKRSHEEISDADQSLGTVGEESREELEDRHDQLRRGVVAHMFDSDWRLDSLINMKLSEVKMPAAIFIRKDGKIEKYTGPMPDGDQVVPDIDVLVRQPWPGAMVDSLPPTQPSQTSISYIVKNHPQRGAFNKEAAKKLKVAFGRDYGKLAAGENVISTDGKTITPDMVLSPGKEGNGFALLDIPDRSYIEATLAREELVSESVMTGIGTIIWILGPGVYGEERLAKFMNQSKIQHIVSSSDVCSNYIALESPASAAIRLNMVDPKRFPIPVHNNIPATSIEKDENIVIGRVGKTIELQPSFKVTDASVVETLDTANVVKTMPDEVLKLAVEAHQRIENLDYMVKLNEQQEDLLCKDAEIITLGTGSALPSKYRNVSATLLRIPEYGNYLFDAGENTLGQMKRVFGKELPQILKDLKVIWISHLHADHHLGTASVIRAWNAATKDDPKTKDNKLMVASAKGMLSWLEEYASIEDYGYTRVMPVDPTKSSPELVHHTTEYQLSAFNITSIKAVRVNHCRDALAVVFEMPNGFKVAYSGDCRPSSEFVKVGKGATLLIHEATFDDELQGDAYAKKHSTTSEALDIGLRMGARRILLTHFSQRYQKIPVLENTSGKDQVAIVAFDYMRCKIGDFAKLAEFRPALLKLYEEEEEGVLAEKKEMSKDAA